MNVEAIAKICHEANRAYCQTMGDFSHLPWESAPEWVRQSAIEGVKFRLANPYCTPQDMHANWMRQKLEAGWTYGMLKDEEAKTHPCLVAYGELPKEQRVKDKLFSSIVSAMSDMGWI